jgi:hypothetical protein
MKQPPFDVMCILNPSHWKAVSAKTGMTFPKVGDECTVTEVSNDDGEMCYTLAEHGPLAEYAADCFAIMPDKNQEKEIECENEALIYQR